LVGSTFQRDELAGICRTKQLVDLLIGQIALAGCQGLCRNQLSALEGEEHTSKVGDLNQTQTLVWGIEAESEAILRKADDDGRVEGSFGGEGEVDLGEGACVGLELGQDVKQGGAEDCERGSEWVEAKGVWMTYP
jgi:hypothetical protein